MGHQLLENADDGLECEVDVLDAQSNSASSVLSPSASSRAAPTFAPFRAAARRTRRDPYVPPLLSGAVIPGLGEKDSHETPVPREASQTSDVGVSAGSLRATLGLVDPRSDPKVHSIVAEKQLPTELLDEWTSWAWMKDEEPVHSLEIFTQRGRQIFAKACPKSGPSPRNDWISEETWSALRVHGRLKGNFFSRRESAPGSSAQVCVSEMESERGL